MRSHSKVVVRYAETDQMGIVHHSNYPIWYEVARTDLIKKIGMTYSQMEEMGVTVPLIELECRYMEPAYYEDVLQIEVHLGKVSPVKLEFCYQIFKSGKEQPINTGRTLHGLVGKDLKPLYLKKSHPELYEKLLKAKEK